MTYYAILDDDGAAIVGGSDGHGIGIEFAEMYLAGDRDIRLVKDDTVLCVAPVASTQHVNA